MKKKITILGSTGSIGENALKIDVRDFTPGVYMYTMTVGGESISKRMVISKK